MRIPTNHRFDTGPHNRLDGPVLRRVDAVFAVSDEARDSLRSEYAAIAHALTIPSRVDPRTFQAATPSLDLAHPIVAMVARLAPERAPPGLPGGRRRCPRGTFRDRGDGPLREELVQQAGPNDLRGFPRRHAGVYASLDVLVQPSYREACR